MVKTRQMDSILEALECADTLDGLQSATEALRDLMGIDHVIYHWVDSTGEQYACGTYSRAWQERYLEQNYLRIDPVVIGCYNRFHPVDWKRLDWSSKASRAFMAEAIEYGIGSAARTGSSRCSRSTILRRTRSGPPSSTIIGGP